jgi:hypothetical protein
LPSAAIINETVPGEGEEEGGFEFDEASDDEDVDVDAI